MNLLPSIHFLRPWWLLALLVLPLLAWWWRSQAQRRNPWRDVVDAHLLPHLLEGEAADRTRAWPRWLALAAAALAIWPLERAASRAKAMPSMAGRVICFSRKIWRAMWRWVT